MQFITLDLNNRDRAAVAREWIAKLAAAIRHHDKHHLITVGLVPWSLNKPGLTSGFVPSKIAAELDFVAVHIYPKSQALAEAVETIKAFKQPGKPLVIEETFPLECTPAELAQVIDQTRDATNGRIGFYWGQTAKECRQTNTIAGAITAAWLEFFQKQAKN